MRLSAALSGEAQGSEHTFTRTGNSGAATNTRELPAAGARVIRRRSIRSRETASAAGTRDLHSFFRGGLAGVRIWDCALDAAEIQNLYETGEVAKRGLVAEWKLNEGRGSTAHDSAHGWDGLIVGAEWSVLSVRVRRRCSGRE
jgi:hypothetical protein